MCVNFQGKICWNESCAKKKRQIWGFLTHDTIHPPKPLSFFVQIAFQCISSWNFTHIHVTSLFTCRKKIDFFETKKFRVWIFQEVCLHGGRDPKRHTRQRKQLNQSLERNIPFWPHSPRPKNMKEIHCRRYEPAWLRRVLGDGVLD